MRHAMIMAGGAGTRLWPMSRLNRPKQLLPLIGGQSLLDIALKRVESLVPPEGRWICTNENFRAAIRKTLGTPDSRILGEPVGRDTLNAVGFSAAVIAKTDPEAVMAVLTADHIIEPVDRFSAAIARGFDLIEESPETLVTFSVVPTRPATGYGYIERAEALPGPEPTAYRVLRYVEKPDEATARKYLAAGTFGWSSGMFAFRAQTILDVIKRFQPEAHAGLMLIAEAWNAKNRDEIVKRVYPTLPRISFDYAIMEPASHDDSIPVATVPMEVNWLDIGSWPSLAETIEPDTNGNRTFGHAELLHCTNVLSVNEDANDDENTHLITAIGCEDLIIVHTKDATLICPANRAEEIKALVAKVPEELR